MMAGNAGHKMMADNNGGYDKKSLHITNIPSSLTEKNLKNLLSNYGKIEYFVLKTSRLTDKMFAICKFVHLWDAETALSQLRKPSVLNLRVSYAKLRCPKNENTAYNNMNNNSGNNDNFENSFESNVQNNFSNDIKSPMRNSLESNKKDLVANLRNICLHNECTCSDKNCEDFVQEFERKFEINKNLEVRYRFGDCSQCHKFLVSPIIIDISAETFKVKTEQLNDNNISETNSRPRGNDCSIIIQSSFLDQSCNEDPRIGLEIMRQLSENVFASVAVPVLLSDTYNTLFSDLFNDCNDQLKNNKRPESSDDMLAVSIVENNEKKWYRAILHNKSVYVLIDRCLIKEKNEIVDVISCPKAYTKIPMFGSVITLLGKTDESLEPGTCFIADVKEGGVDKFLIKFCDVSAKMERWNYSSEVTQKNPPKKTSPLEYVFSLKSSNNQLKPSVNLQLTKLQLKNRTTVIIIHYENAKNIYVRLGGYAAEKEHSLLLDSAIKEGLTASPIKTKPEKNDRLLCKIDKFHYRCVVSDYDNSKDLYKLCIIDNGGVHYAKMNELYECSNDLKNRPMVVARIALMNADKIICNEPSKKVVNFMNKMIKQEIPMICTFEGKSPSENGVQLKNNNTNKILNLEIEELAMSPIDRMKKFNIEPHDLPVFLMEHMPTVDFKDLVSAKPPIELMITGQWRLMEDKYVGCTKINPSLWTEYEDMVKQLNSYCERQESIYMPRKGELCLAKHDKTNKWLRGIACNTNVDELMIFFPDIYDVEKVNISDIRKFLQDFMDVPFMSCLIYISGMYGGDIDKDALSAMVDIMKAKTTLTITKVIKKEGEGYVVECPEIIDGLKSRGFKL